MNEIEGKTGCAVHVKLVIAEIHMHLHGLNLAKSGNLSAETLMMDTHTKVDSALHHNKSCRH